MNYKQGQSSMSEVAERYRTLTEEYRLQEGRLQRALAHKSTFSEKVFSKVTSDYRKAMESIAHEQSILEGQLRAELASLERQLQALVPQQQEFYELMEELELRCLTGEISGSEYQRKKAELEAKKPPSGSQLHHLEQTLHFYRNILGIEDGVIEEQEQSFDEDPPDRGTDVLTQEPPLLEQSRTPYPTAAASYTQPEVHPAKYQIQSYIEENEPVEEFKALDTPQTEDDLSYFEEVHEDTPSAMHSFQEDEEALFRNTFQEEKTDEQHVSPDDVTLFESPAVHFDEPMQEEAASTSNLEEINDVEIPEDLFLDEDDDYEESFEDLEPIAQEELLEESYEDALIDEDTPGVRTLEPVVIIKEGMPDERIYYMTGNMLTIGRGPDNDIQLPTDTSVSRHHSRISYEDDEYWISDLGSSNGTTVNGARVTKTVLSGEDEISIGQTILKFKFI